MTTLTPAVSTSAETLSIIGWAISLIFLPFWCKKGLLSYLGKWTVRQTPSHEIRGTVVKSIFRSFPHPFFFYIFPLFLHFSSLFLHFSSFFTFFLSFLHFYSLFLHFSYLFSHFFSFFLHFSSFFTFSSLFYIFPLFLHLLKLSPPRIICHLMFHHSFENFQPLDFN